MNLSACQLSCGYLQRLTRNEVQITLWREHTTYHVRVHDFSQHRRLCWQSFRTLTHARQAYARAARAYVRNHPMEKSPLR